MENCKHPKDRIWQYNGWWKCCKCYFEGNGIFKYSKFFKEQNKNEKEIKN